MILIVTHYQDLTVVRLTKHLKSRGHDPVIIDSAAVEGETELSLEGGAEGVARCLLRVNGRDIDLEKVRSAWLWRPWERFPEEAHLRNLATRPTEWTFYRREWLAFHKGFVMALAYSDVFCVNRPPYNVAFEEKICQMMIASQVGLKIPDTLYTARPVLAKEFYARHGGKIIYKPFSGFAHLVEGEGKPKVARLYTSRVKEAHLVEPAGFVPTPCLFQPYVEKDIELRIVIVGRQVFACSIHSQRSELSREDWRRFDLENTPYEPFELPAEIERQLLALMDRLGLVFGSVDMILTPEGEYVFIEINPNGQFDWIAHRTGLPIYEALADMLVAASAA
jgi:glutathione synthase/RimK-type ligase-like ATP-grasp enzyme